MELQELYATCRDCKFQDKDMNRAFERAITPRKVGSLISWMETQKKMIEQRDNQIEGLLTFLTILRKDLLLRSDTDSEGDDVVNLSASLWDELKEITEERLMQVNTRQFKVIE